MAEGGGAIKDGVGSVMTEEETEVWALAGREEGVAGEVGGAGKGGGGSEGEKASSHSGEVGKGTGGDGESREKAGGNWESVTEQ